MQKIILNLRDGQILNKEALSFLNPETVQGLQNALVFWAGLVDLPNNALIIKTFLDSMQQNTFKVRVLEQRIPFVEQVEISLVLEQSTDVNVYVLDVNRSNLEKVKSRDTFKQEAIRLRRVYPIKYLETLFNDEIINSNTDFILIE